MLIPYIFYLDCEKSMNESLFNMLIQIKYTDNQPCLFPPLQFSTVSSSHHFTCCLHYSAIVKWSHLLFFSARFHKKINPLQERYSESVARCHCLQNLVL